MIATPNPPSFTREELELVRKNEKLVHAARNCPWELRRAFDVLDDINRGVRPAVLPGPCRSSSDDTGARASDEGALDILKILKEASGQGTSREYLGATGR